MVNDVVFLTIDALEAGLDHIRQSPKDAGEVALIVSRPTEDERAVLDEGELDVTVGLVGDSWQNRPSRHFNYEAPHPEKQLNIMNSRVIGLLSPDESRWSLAGDQFFVDLDLSAENLPPGTQLAFGTAIVEVTEPPHTGCKKFSARFGVDAVKFVNSPAGKQLKLRGICAKVVQNGTVKQGELIRKL